MHLIGKDIVWFHTVIWPAMLLSAGLLLSPMLKEYSTIFVYIRQSRPNKTVKSRQSYYTVKSCKTYKTVRAKLWPELSGNIPASLLIGSLVAQQRHPETFPLSLAHRLH